MKKLVMAALILLVCAASAQAGPIIQPGTFITWRDTGVGSTSGGEFEVTKVQGPDFEKFVTFCVQTNEFLYVGEVLYVGSITNYAEDEDAVGQRDVVDNQTKWIYQQYLADGEIAGLTGGRLANAVQWAIWYLEDESAAYQPATGSAGWVDREAVLLAAQSGVYRGGIGVMNLYHTDIVNGQRVATTKAQDLLAPVPEPGTLLLFGTGLVGLAKLARRRRA